jgi:hypothetical protein
MNWRGFFICEQRKLAFGSEQIKKAFNAEGGEGALSKTKYSVISERSELIRSSRSELIRSKGSELIPLLSEAVILFF